MTTTTHNGRVTPKKPAPEVPNLLDFDADTLTFGELERLEELLGGDAAALASIVDEKPTVKALVALVCVMAQRTNPKFTMADARKLKVTSVFSEKPTE